MTVKIIKTGEMKEFDPSYGARLIEQGIAVPAPAPETPKPAEAPKDTEAPAAEPEEPTEPEEPIVP